MSRENYFILFELDTSEEDWVVIKDAIKKKQLEWGKLRSHPTKGTLAQQNMSNIPDANRILSDTKLRSIEAKEAKRILAEKQRSLFKSLDEALFVLTAKGFILESQIEALKKKFKALTPAQIQSRIKVPIKKLESGAKAKKAAPLDPSMAKLIRSNLDILEKQSLYDFLGLKPSSSLKVIRAETERIDQANKLISRKDAAVTASGELIGFCKNLFKDEISRSRYNSTLEEEKKAGLKSLLNLAGESGTIFAATYEKLLIKAVDSGMAREEAETFLKEYAKKKKWAIEVTSSSAFDSYQKCGFCGAFPIEKNRNECTNCGLPLKVECPNCATSNPSSTSYCRKCLFSIADMPYALKLIREAKTLISKGNLPEATQLFESANQFWPGHPEINDWNKERKNQEALQKSFEKELAELDKARKFQALIKLLRELKQKVGSSYSFSELERRANAQEKKASILMSNAILEPNRSKKIEILLKALEVCSDYEPAQKEMRHYPPPPPQNLIVKKQSSGFSLTWSPVNEPGLIQYLVSRKSYSQDGKVTQDKELGQGTSFSYKDDFSQVGLPIRYFVHTIRNGVRSPNPAESSPVMVLSPVTGLNATAKDKEVLLEWVPPQGASHIEVWRKQGGIPYSRGETGTRRILNEWSNFKTDKDLKNETLHGYLVIAVFKDIDGNEYHSIGSKISATPETMPERVELSGSLDDGTLNLRFTPPPRGEVTIWTGYRSWGLKPGDSTGILPHGEPHAPQGKNQCSIPINHHGLIFAIAINKKNDVRISGRERVFESFQEVGNLKVTSGHQKDSHQVRWSWPPKVQEVWVYYSETNEWPYPPLKKNRTNQGTAGSATIGPFTVNGDMLYVKVLTIFQANGKNYQSPGVTAQYRVKKTILTHFRVKKGRRGFQLFLKSSGPVSVPLDLYVGEDTVPSRPDQPNTSKVIRIEPRDWESNSLSLSFNISPPTMRFKYLYFVLHADSDLIKVENNEVRIKK